MLIFDEKELLWIRKELTCVLDDTNKEYIKYVDEEEIVKARTVLENLELINTDEVINEMCLDTLFYVLGMWVWGERLSNPVTEIGIYINDEDYCNIFKKLMEYDKGLKQGSEKKGLDICEYYKLSRKCQ